MYKKGTDNIILTIEERNSSNPSDFDNAMIEIREQLQDLDTYYIESSSVGNFSMLHMFYNLNRDVAYNVTDLDVMLAMDGNELNFLAYELEDEERTNILNMFGIFEDDEDDEDDDIDILDIEALNYTGEQFAELQFEYDSGVYGY